MKKIGFNLLLFTLVVNTCYAQCWELVSAGGTHTIGLKSNHTLWAWGDNGFGQLGDGTNTIKTSPIKIGTDSNWKLISAGSLHNAAIKMNGSLWCWGFNAQGGVGDSTWVDRNTPTLIGNDTTWKIVSCGNGFTLALKTDGTLWSWGANYYGQLGNGNLNSTNVPMQIGTANDWKNIFAGDDHSFAIKNDGTLWAWGWNPYGGLGDGTNVNKNVPTQIGVDTDWLTIGPGFQFTTAVKTNGTLWAWGINSYGQLGNGIYTSTYSPIHVGTDSTWISCSSGNQHSLATKSNGTLWSWGNNWSGQLGNNSTLAVNHPIQIGYDTNWSFVQAAKSAHSIGLRSSGDLYAWGENTFGQLGIGSSSNFYTFPIMINCPIIPQIPLLSQIPPMLCENAGTQVGKCLNPFGIVDITLDGNPIVYNYIDSTFTYGPSIIGSHILHVTYTNGAGTAYIDTVFSTMAIPTVAVNSVPIVPDVCFGQPVILNATGGNSVVWSNGITNNVSFTPSTSTTYTVTVSDANNCSNTSTIYVAVSSFINPSLSISSSITQGSTGDAISYSINTNVSLPYSIKWYLNSVFQTSTTTAVWNTNLVAGMNNVYAVISSPTQCLQPDSATSNILNISNITHLSSSQFNNLAVYPNPFNKSIYFNCIEPTDQVMLVNMVGQILFQQMGESIMKDQFQISTYNLPRGVYQLIVSRNKLEVKFSLIK